MSGEFLPLYGVGFFENTIANTQSSADKANINQTLPGVLNPYSPSIKTPVSADYALGVGDQVLIRAWGSLDINYRAVIDRSGLISIPKVGTIPLLGVKISDAESVIKQAIDKYFKNYDLNVSLGQTRSVTIYLVGQARRPGSYNLSAMSTISTALFATGGPNANGSMRRVQLKRNGSIVSEFDLYQFLAFGNAKGDLKLVDGDVLLIPPALGYVALSGKLKTPAVYELKSNAETLDQILEIAGGLPVNTNPVMASLDRLNGQQKAPRSIANINLQEEVKTTTLKNGDLLTFFPLSNEISNAVTLKGHVSQPMRMAWRPGLKISDLIPNRESLITREAIRAQNEILFNSNERERTQIVRESIPTDLIETLKTDKKNSTELTDSKNTSTSPNAKADAASVLGSSMGTTDPSLKGNNPELQATLQDWNQSRVNRLASSLPTIPLNNPPSLSNNLGRLITLPNFEYAVVERLNRQDLGVQIIPFNLGKVLENASSVDNLSLEPGDVVTVFSQDDLSFPKSKQKILVQIEGEVKSPGVYPVNPGETLPEFIKRVGGLTSDAYLFGTALYREEVRKSQIGNLSKLLRNLEAQSSSTLSQMSQSLGASTNPGVVQAKILSAQQAQQAALQRLKNLRPEGRIALGTSPGLENDVDQLPQIHLSNNDKIKIPARPDFVYVYGSVNTESALIYKTGWTVAEYLQVAGMGNAADKKASILIRADGTALTSNSFWGSEVLGTKVLPGDTIVLPEKADQETVWSTVVRSTMDYTQIFYQLGLGAAAIKTLRQ